MPVIRDGYSYDPTLTGVYIIETAGANDITRAITASIPGVVGVADWGSDASIVTVTTVQELLDNYGTRATGSLVKFVETLLNQGVGQVRCFRVVGSGKVKATASKAAGVATTWDFTALYYGTVGNDITYQVLAGDITNTVTVEIIKDGKVYRCSNVTNLSTDANYIGTKWDCDWVTFAKTGTATTLPTADASHVHLAAGANGSTPADSDLVTGLVALEADLTINRVAIASAASATIRTGLAAHCAKTYNRIGFVGIISNTTAAAIVVEAAAYNDNRLVDCVPTYSYYNSETGLYEDQEIAHMMGVVCRYAPWISPIRKQILGTGILVDTYTNAEQIQLHNAGIFFGGAVFNTGNYCLSSLLEYSKTDAFWGDIQIRSAYDVIENYLDVQFSRVIGYQGTLSGLKMLLTTYIESAMRYMKNLGILTDYRFDLSENTAATMRAGEAYAKIWTEVPMAIHKVIIRLGKMADYTVQITEEVV